MQNPISTIGTPPPSMPVYEALLSFIDTVIENFRPYSQKNNTIVEAEDDITTDLSFYLDDLQETKRLADILNQKEIDNLFYFKFINQDNRADIGVKLGRGYRRDNSKSFCWIEAKRLPTPNNSNKTLRDEREYVYVDNSTFKGGGGIQRFKLNRHTSNLPLSIIIGYVQEQNFEFWISCINNWIKELSKISSLWSEKEILTPYSDSLWNRYISHHRRIDEKTGIELAPIILHHFWIDLSRS